jgi:hypothetical protein
MRFAAVLACAVMLPCLGSVAASGQKLIALLVGSDRSTNLSADQQLKKVVNDSRAVGHAPHRLGFEAISGENLGRQALADKLDEFTPPSSSEQSEAAQPHPFLIQYYREQAEAAAVRISQFIKEIESQVGWTTQLPWSAGTIDQRRFDGLRLLRQVPAITELSQLDATGHEQLRVSRLAMDVVASKADLSKEPKFAEAVAHKVYYGPVYFRRESEPYMTLALAGTRPDAGVSVVEVKLKVILDSVSQMKIGTSGQAYVLDKQGRLIAHPDPSLVKRNTDFSRLPQLQAAHALAAGQAVEQVQLGDDIQGRRVVSAYARVSPVEWLVFVELPVTEATLH